VEFVAVFCALGSLLLAGGLAAVIVGVSRRARRRLEALELWATRNGWTPTQRPQAEWYRFLPGSDRRGVSLALTGTVRGRMVSVAEYSYTETSYDAGATTSSSTTHRFVVVVVRLGRPYPWISVETRGTLSKLGRKLFGDSQAATGDEEFDRRFRISTREPAVARQVVGRQLIAAHLAGAVPAWTVSGHELLTYRDGSIDVPEHVPAFAEPALRVADLLGR
jgi:hypothetical protein